jgi:membrane fusion protein (multidrug efflux system)
MKKRMVIVVGAMMLLILALGSLKFLQIRAAMAEYAGFQPPPEAVTTVVASEEAWPSTLGAIGSVVAVQGVTVAADLPGIIEKISFESGGAVRKGALLVQLDASQERAQLAAAESAAKLARVNLDRMSGLRQKGVSSQAELDRMQAEAEQAEARVGEIRATIDRKRIRAPFDGVLGIRQVNLGQYLQGGDAVVSLQALDPIFVDFAVPQQDAARLTLGHEVNVAAEGLSPAPAPGKIAAVDSIVDEATRNVRIRASFANPGRTLRPGMFVEAKVSLGAATSAITLPTSAINYAPYGDSVYVVEEMSDPAGKSYSGVRQQVVKLGPSRGDQVAVVHGLKAGEEIVTSGVFKLRPGAAVFVNNDVQPDNNAAPEPEDS